MIVMGAFGHNPLHELFFGSTTLETLAEAQCPVLLMG
jgi:nucleotide-binding universal stress UspA family protein